MPYTVPNQKTICIHKEHPKSDFLQIKNENWMRVNKELSPYGLQLYLYFAKNANGYQFSLSPEAAEKEAGINKTTFHKYVGILIEKGYLVKWSGNTFDFYETPYEQNEDRSPNDGPGNLPDEKKKPCSKPPSSSGEQKAAWDDIEIDIKDRKETIDKGIDNDKSMVDGDVDRTFLEKMVLEYE